MSPLRCLELSKNFRGVRAVNRLNLEVPPGAIYGLVGPNGAGKTTALKTMMNIFRPTVGLAEVLGCDSRRLSPREFARIGYVSENQAMPDYMTVNQLMAYFEPFYPAWDRGHADHLLDEFALPRDRKLSQLSRGMWMKTALASSLAYRPELLILDEPFSGLDPLVREDLIRGILTRAEDMTIVISSHDLADIESFASHIGYMDRGRLLFSEEMSSLADRFREVEVTVDVAPLPVTSAAWPAHWPTHWLSPEISSALIRFVDTRFDPERTNDEVRKMFSGVRNISASPMPLRSIFLTLARSSQA